VKVRIKKRLNKSQWIEIGGDGVVVAIYADKAKMERSTFIEGEYVMTVYLDRIPIAFVHLRKEHLVKEGVE